MRITIVSRPGETHSFADYATIQTRLNEFDEALSALDEASYEDKVEALAYPHGELNEIHPFRDDNGRATQAFIEAIAARHAITLS